MDLPEDLRLITLKYDGRCRSCKVVLEKGERAHWSPSTKVVLCGGCAVGENSSVETVSNRPTDSSQSSAADGDSNIVGSPKPDAEGPQAPWQQLCRYAQRCIEAETANSLVPYTKANSLWFIHLGVEELVVGQSDSTPAPGKLADQLNSANRAPNQRSIIYGWPTVVVIDRDRKPKVAPLFSVQIEPERSPANEWRLNATVEPEFNLAITAGGLFDPSIADEIDSIIGDSLPFGDSDAFSVLAGQIASLLGFEICSPFDPENLASDVPRNPGVYNAAISVLTEATGYNVTVIEELKQLQRRKDWTTTAVAHLIFDESVPGEDRPPPSGPLAAPLVCNQSQEETLERLRRNPLTVVTGPPGTGKTQLVVNAVTNAWLDGEKILVSSTNNAAVDVAVERAEKDVCSGLLMRTGNRSVREQVPGRIAAATDQAAKYDGNRAEARATLKRVTTERTQLMEKLARLDKLNEEILQSAETLEKTEVDLKAAAQLLWTGAKSPKPSIDSHWIERRASRLLRAWLFCGFRTRRFYRRLGCIGTARLEQIVAWARLDRNKIELTRRLETGRVECGQLNAAVGDPAVSIREIDRKWADASHIAIRADTAARFRTGADRLSAFGRGSAGNEPFKRAVGNALESLRGWACTALSASPNFPLEAGLFDLVIVDEASQCNLAAVLPLAYRAKRLAVVGDPCQLHPIVPLGDGLLQEVAAQAGFDSDDLRRRGIHHKYGSAYFAFEFAAKPDAPVLLNEHYRCHPHIARWFNRTFYNDELTVLTDVAATSRRDRTIVWQDVEGTAERPASGSSWLNRAEAKQTIEQLGDTLKTDSTVGVVTPFAAQARLIERRARERFGQSKLDEAEFVCGTSHRLQGDERDAIIFSSVVAPGISDNGARWIEKQNNLLNVAVSRARRALIVFGHPFIGERGNPTLASLRAYLRDEVTGKEDAAQPSAEFRVDSRSEAILLDALQLQHFQPFAKLNVEGYELDFALMEQGIRLNIEVDGDQHLDVRGRQRRQDITRDRVLSNLGWTVLRIPAWRCHEEIDSVICEIQKTRDQLLP